MTRKDYVLIAHGFKVAMRLLSDSTPGERIGWETSVRAVAHQLSMTNPRFDRERFYAACGL